MNKNVLEIILKLKDEISSEIESMSKRFEKTGKSLSSVGESMIKIGAAPTAALLLAAKTAIDYESAFAGVRKTVDASEADFQKLSDNIRRIAKESPASANELAKIGEIAGQLGVRGVDNLTKFIDTISKVGVTTNLSSEAAATSFARIANIMQENIGNVDKMASSVVELGNNFATTESEVVEFANRIAGAGKIAGLTTSDIFGIGAAWSSVGVEAEAGGTAVQKILIAMTEAAAGTSTKFVDNSKKIATNSQRLNDLKKSLDVAKKQQSEFGDKVKESTKMQKQAQIDKYSAEINALGGKLSSLNATNGQAVISSASFAKVLGLTNKQFETMFKKDPSGVFQKFVAKLGAAGTGAMKILEDLDLTDQRLIRGILSVANAGDLQARAVKASADAWKKNSALTNEANKRFATTESQLKILKNNFTDIGITLGSVLLPNINSLISSLKPMVESFSKYAKEHPQLISGILIAGTAFGALGVVLVAVGSMISSIATIITALSPLMASFGAITGAISSPVLIAIAAFAALVAVGYLVWQNWELIKTKTTEIWGAVTAYLGTLPGIIGGFFTDLFLNKIPFAIGYAIGWLSVKIPELITNMKNWFWMMVLNIGILMMQFYSVITDAVTNTWSWISTEVPTWPEKILAFIKNIPQLVSQVFEDARKWVVDKMSSMYNGIMEIWDKIKGIFESITNKANDAWNAAKRGIDAGQSAALKGSRANGGWINGTGPYQMHDGEYVLSKDMLAGKQPIDGRVFNSSVNNSRNANVTINAVINNPLDFDKIIDSLSWKMNSAY